MTTDILTPGPACCRDERRSGAVLATRRPFLRADAIAAGLTDKQLRSSRFRRLHVGVYVASDVPVTPGIRAAAALLPFGVDAYASRATAARVWRLPMPTLPEEHVTLSHAVDRRRRTDIRCHVAPTGSPPLLAVVGQLPVSGAEQVFVELAEQLDLVDLVVVLRGSATTGDSSRCRS